MKRIFKGLSKYFSRKNDQTKKKYFERSKIKLNQMSIFERVKTMPRLSSNVKNVNKFFFPKITFNFK